MTDMAESSDFDGIFNVDDPSLVAPENMRSAIDALFPAGSAPQTECDHYRTAYRSLAFRYAEVIREIEETTNRTFNKIYIVGGGAKNKLINRYTAEFTGKEVVALPIEATAIGNLKCQMKIKQEI